MLDPVIELFNGTSRPMMFVMSTPFFSKPTESIIEASESLTLYDQRQVITAMIRELTAKELDDYLKEKEMMKKREERQNG